MRKLFTSTSHLGRPWAIQEAAMRGILARVAEEERSFAAIAKEWGEYDDGSFDVTVYDGVAVIPVYGVLMRQWSFWSWFSGSSAYELLIKDIATAVADPAVKAIVLDIDSPGGEVTGVDELATAIRSMNAEKPIVAYGTGTVASAAYWIAAACDQVVISKTSAVGSIGCMATILDYSAAREAAGVKEYRFISSQSPMKNAAPGTADGDTAIQTEVDAIAGVFVNAVALFRQVSIDKVLADFGQGGVLTGQAAVDAGLADAVGSLEEVIAELNEQTADVVGIGDPNMALLKALSKTSRVAAKRAEDQKPIEDAESEDEMEPDPADPKEDQETDAEDDTTDQETDAEGDETDPEDKPAGKKAKGEKGRIAAILRSAEADGRRQLAEHLAFDTSM